MKKIITCLLAVLGLTSACGQSNFENTDVQGFSELIADSSVVILDVRTSAEFAEGHIQGAVLIDQGQSDFVEKAKATLSTEKTIAIYCRSGRRSANAANRLAEVGFKCVNLKGGIIAWKEAEKPVVTELYTPPIVTRRLPRFVPSRGLFVPGRGTNLGRRNLLIVPSVCHFMDAFDGTATWVVHSTEGGIPFQGDGGTAGNRGFGGDGACC